MSGYRKNRQSGNNREEEGDAKKKETMMAEDAMRIRKLLYNSYKTTQKHTRPTTRGAYKEGFFMIQKRKEVHKRRINYKKKYGNVCVKEK